MRVVALTLALVLCGCRNEQPPAPTAEQNQQLNEADAMLNEMGKEEGPEANATGPSSQSD